MGHILLMYQGSDSYLFRVRGVVEPDRWDERLVKMAVSSNQEADAVAVLVW
jgi:hypothetical protein